MIATPQGSRAECGVPVCTLIAYHIDGPIVAGLVGERLVDLRRRTDSATGQSYLFEFLSRRGGRFN